MGFSLYFSWTFRDKCLTRDLACDRDLEQVLKYDMKTRILINHVINCSGYITRSTMEHDMPIKTG